MTQWLSSVIQWKEHRLHNHTWILFQLHHFLVLRIFVQIRINEVSCCCCSVVSNSLRPHGLQHASASPSPGVCSNSVMSPDHLLLCCPLLFLPSIFPSIRIFSNELALRIRWPKYWNFSISPFNEYLGLTALISYLSKGLSKVFSNTTVQKYHFFGAQPSSQSNSHIHTWPQEKP